MSRPKHSPQPDSATRCYDRIACGLYFSSPDERRLITLQDRFPPSPCRRTRPHITIRGASRPGQLTDALGALEELAGGLPALDVQLTGIVVGEDPQLGMTIVLEVKPSPEILELEAAVRGKLDGLLPLVGSVRSFVPHVTLYRREVTPLNDRARALAHSLSFRRTLRVDHLSIAGEREATWHPVRHFAFGVA